MFRPIFFTTLLAVSSVAHAADKPLYAPAPDWVKPAPAIDPASIHDDSPVFLIRDNQQQLKDGQVTAYIETAARVASTQMLDSLGTIKLPWQPDKGDLTIHRVEIIRGTEHIDLLATGGQFSVLRREAQLEQQQLNGVLTATMAVEGLRVGDVLHLSFSITQKDPTLKGNVQAFGALIAEPFRVQYARTRIIWPQDADIHWKVNASGVQPLVTTAGGYRELTVTQPLPKQPEMPADAPARFKRPPQVEATSFDGWSTISKVMAPLYATDGLIAPGSPLAAEVAKIAAAESDPLKRTAVALQLVQDKVRYLFKGMDQGNYVPQTPTQTWALRYGDCKAKTLLLLAILHSMGIEAEPVLASIQLGDLVQDRLPTPGAFDHVFVRATVAGETLWLDGTGAGSRLADIHDAPPFRFVLPVRAAGAALMPVPMRAGARPDLRADIELDESAGMNFPAPFRLAVTVRGGLAELIHAGSAQASKDDMTKMVAKLSEPYLNSPLIVAHSLSFDEAAGTATVNVSGLSYPEWSKENERYRNTLDRAVSQTSFEPDRTRPAWRDIPVATDDPRHIVVRTRVHLPDGGKGFTLDGDQKLATELAGNKIAQTATLVDGWITTDVDMMSTGQEIAVADIGAVRQRLDQAKQHLLRAVAPQDAPAAWQIVEAGKRGHRFDPILAVYKQGIADQPGKADPFRNRAWFFERLYERSQAIQDLTSAIAIDPSVENYLWRARLYDAINDKPKALADVMAARKVDPASANAAGQLAALYADSGKKDQALTLLDERIDQAGKDKPNFMAAKAEILSESGDKEGAIATIDAAIVASPGNPDLLNARCWVKGTLNTMLDTALKDCTKAIELSESPQKAMDSRAMVYFRLKRFDDALADLNAALDIDPDLPASMYMRGVIRKQMGDAKAGEGDLAAARMMTPTIDHNYAKFGIVP
jgi:tetratricopeptide (TPR) repeat protein